MTRNIIYTNSNVLSKDNFYSYFLSSSLYLYQLSSVFLITFVSRMCRRTLVPIRTCLCTPTRGCYVREGSGPCKSSADSRASDASAQITYDGRRSDA